MSDREPRAVFELDIVSGGIPNNMIEERFCWFANGALLSFNAYSDIGSIVIWDGYPAGAPCFYYKLPRLDDSGNRKKSSDYIPATKDILEYALLQGNVWTYKKKVIFRLPEEFLNCIMAAVSRDPEMFPSIPKTSMQEINQSAAESVQ